MSLRKRTVCRVRGSALLFVCSAWEGLAVHAVRAFVFLYPERECPKRPPLASYTRL